MHNYYLYLVLKQRTFWSVVKQHMKIRVRSEDIDLHTLSVLNQHNCFYSVSPGILVPGTIVFGVWVYVVLRV